MLKSLDAGFVSRSGYAASFGIRISASRNHRWLHAPATKLAEIYQRVTELALPLEACAPCAKSAPSQQERAKSRVTPRGPGLER